MSLHAQLWILQGALVLCGSASGAELSAWPWRAPSFLLVSVSSCPGIFLPGHCQRYLVPMLAGLKSGQKQPGMPGASTYTAVPDEQHDWQAEQRPYCLNSINPGLHMWCVNGSGVKIGCTGPPKPAWLSCKRTSFSRSLSMRRSVCSPKMRTMTGPRPVSSFGVSFHSKFVIPPDISDTYI